MRSSLARVIGVCFAAFVAMPLLTTSSCASSDEGNAGPFTGGSTGDAKNDKGGGGTTSSGGGSSGGSGGMTTGGGGMTSGGGGTTSGGGGATSGGGGSGGGGTCNPQTCPTPASPAVKCCVTANGPCGVDYKQGAGCQLPTTGDI